MIDRSNRSLSYALPEYIYVHMIYINGLADPPESAGETPRLCTVFLQPVRRYDMYDWGQPVKAIIYQREYSLFISFGESSVATEGRKGIYKSGKQILYVNT